MFTTNFTLEMRFVYSFFLAHATLNLNIYGYVLVSPPSAKQTNKVLVTAVYSSPLLPAMCLQSISILDTEQKFENTKIKCLRNVIVNKCKIKVPTVFTRA